MNRKQILYLTLFVVIVLLVISPDSYLHDLFYMGDSNIFFMCGKAWMNGMLPYVDFSDSKGPLLWLIYGGGYLLSPTSKVGMYWISCLWYVAIFVYVYKTARFYLNERQAFLTTILMSLSFFFPLVHREIRAEDFCQLFICASLYETIRYLENHIQLARSMFVLGVSCAGTLLIKFNIIAIPASLMLCLLYCAVKNKEIIIKPCGSFAMGSILLFLPFMIYFLYRGIFQDFLYEYFVRTYLTTQNIPEVNGMIRISRLLNIRKIVSIAPIILGIILLYIGNLRHKETISLSAIIALLCSFGGNHFDHYLQPLSVYWLFGIVFLIKACQRQRWMLFLISHSILSMLITAVIVVFVNILPSARRQDFFWAHNTKRKYYHDVNYVMKQVEKPKVTYLHIPWCFDLSIPSEGLPACRYWFSQTGALPDMEQEQEQAVIARKPDFVFVHMNNTSGVTMLRKAGYHSYEQLTPEGQGVVMYGKEIHQLPPKDYYYSDLDILLKR